MTLAETAPADVVGPDTLTTSPTPAAPDGASGRRIVHNIIALAASRPLTWLSTIGLTILLPRYLGDVNLGKMNLAFAFADWCGLFASFGISTYLAKEVAQRRKHAAALVLNAVLLRLALGVVIGAGAALLASLLIDDPVTRNLIYLLTTHMLLTVFLGVLIGALQGVQELRIVAIVDAVTKVMLLGLIATVLLRGQGPVAVGVAYVVIDVIAVLWTLDAVRRHVGFAGPVTWSAWRSIFRGGMPFLIWETALLTYARVDVVILSFFATDAVLGWYGAAYRLIGIPLVVPTVLMTVLFPALAASARNSVVFNNMARRAVVVVMLASVPMAFGLMALTGRLMELFGYPQEFDNSIMPTVLLAVALPLVGVNMIVGSILAAIDRQRQWAFAGVFAAVLNVSLNFVAIPYTQNHFDNGAIGAAAVTSLTEVFLLVVGQMLMPRGILDFATAVASLKCVAAGAVMGIVVWWAGGVPVILAIPIGMAIYGLGVVVTGAVSRSELSKLRELLTRRSGAGVPPPVPAD